MDANELLEMGFNYNDIGDYPFYEKDGIHVEVIDKNHTWYRHCEYAPNYGTIRLMIHEYNGKSIYRSMPDIEVSSFKTLIEESKKEINQFIKDEQN